MSVRCGVQATATVCPLGLELADPLPHEVGLHRLAVELLHPAGGLLGRQPGDLLEHRLGVGVAGPEPLEVEHADGAEPAELGGRGRGHDAVRRGRHDRQLEPEGVDLPADVDLFGVAGAAARHDGDVVEAVGTASGLADADLDVSHGGGALRPGWGKGSDYPPPSWRVSAGNVRAAWHDGSEVASSDGEGGGLRRRRGGPRCDHRQRARKPGSRWWRRPTAASTPPRWSAASASTSWCSTSR